MCLTTNVSPPLFDSFDDPRHDVANVPYRPRPAGNHPAFAQTVPKGDDGLVRQGLFAFDDPNAHKTCKSTGDHTFLQWQGKAQHTQKSRTAMVTLISLLKFAQSGNKSYLIYRPGQASVSRFGAVALYSQLMYQKKQQIQLRRIRHRAGSLIKPQVRGVLEIGRNTPTKLPSQRIRVVRVWPRKNRRSDHWRRYLFRGVDVLRRENANQPVPPHKSDQIDLEL